MGCVICIIGLFDLRIGYLVVFGLIIIWIEFVWVVIFVKFFVVEIFKFFDLFLIWKCVFCFVFFVVDIVEMVSERKIVYIVNIVF